MPKGQKDLELNQKFLELNDKYFDNFLSKNLIVSKSKRLTRRAGSCYFYVYPNGVVRPLEICVSEKYIEKYPFEIESVLLHEMIHIKLGNTNHGPDFLKELEYLNSTFNLAIKVMGLDMQYFYRCKNCGKVFCLMEKINPLFYLCNDCNSEIEEIV